jgi:hypothetical protein
MVSRSEYPLPILGWKIEYITSLLLLAKQMIQECNKTLPPMENILSNPFKHNCAIQSDRYTVSNVCLMNLLQGSSSALKKLHQIIQPVSQPASKSIHQNPLIRNISIEVDSNLIKQ